MQSISRLNASMDAVHMFGGLKVPPEGEIQTPPTGGREWLKYPKKIKRHFSITYLTINYLTIKHLTYIINVSNKGGIYHAR